MTGHHKSLSQKSPSDKVPTAKAIINPPDKSHRFSWSLSPIFRFSDIHDKTAIGVSKPE